MKWKIINKKTNLWCVVLEKNEELVSSLIKFCETNKIASGYFSAIGACNKAKIGEFRSKSKNYVYKTIKGEMEILCAMGNVTLLNNKPFPHVHLVVSANESVFGGHATECLISLTCEIFFTNCSSLHRSRSNLGINVIDL